MMQQLEDSEAVASLPRPLGDHETTGVVALIIAVGFSLYVLRSYKVHGKAPWQRDRKREAFERQQRIEQELEDKLLPDVSVPPW